MWVECRPLTKVGAWESLRRVRLWEEIKSSNLSPLVLIDIRGAPEVVVGIGVYAHKEVIFAPFGIFNGLR